MVRYAFFLGCNIPFYHPDIEQSIRKTLPRLGIELEDMRGYTCCPTPGTLPSLDETAWLAVSARNISIAEEMGLHIVTGCNGCYAMLNHAREALLLEEEKRERVNELLKLVDREFRGTSEILHVTHVLHRDAGVDKIRNSLERTLDGFRVAIQYGCHQLWPSELYGHDDPLKPRSLRELCEALGATVRDYSRLLLCCGGSGLRGVAQEKSYDLVKVKLDSVREETDAEMLIAPCVSCITQLDAGQVALRKTGRIDYSIPILYYTQVLALCMGIDPREVAVVAETPQDEIIKRIVGNKSA